MTIDLSDEDISEILSVLDIALNECGCDPRFYVKFAEKVQRPVPEWIRDWAKRVEEGGE